MTRATEGLRLEATGGCIALIAGAAVGLIIYATFILVRLVADAAVQAISNLSY